ncbi:putative Tetratricopeptide repeat protein [Candidatus Sulfotelmatobacter kueseliae]|uniref:Putative Tetratricopeptide repeat protein n=1 Tax=Candidatus Sulfotelmatobacter kueseliae TaxID=2042962 RepID=A0A2U3KXQ3_9BACT|nr:putative Tetratricopeptide repeat protein [Candidatus Sulfotelmatobacter kueseliae]
MSNVSKSSQNWNNVQTYGMAVTCLLLGIAAGYFLHAPVEARPNTMEAAVASNPPFAPASMQMPSAADLKRMADKQVAPLLEQLQKDPKDADLLAKIGSSYMAAQQFDSARQYYEQSVAVKPQADVMNQLAFVYVKLGDLDKGIETLNQALTVDPKNPGILYNLGFYEWKGKADPKAAIAAWNTLLKVDPKNPKRAEVEQMMAQAKKHLGIAPGTKTEKPAS